MIEARIKVTGAEWIQSSGGSGLLLRSSDTAKIRNLCDGLAPGKEYELRLTESRKKRSLNANAYFWVLVDRLAELLKTSREELYRGYIREYGLWRDFPPMPEAEANTLSTAWGRLGIGWFTERMPGPDGEMVIVRCYYGSSVYNTRQMSRLLEQVIEDAKEQGIDTITPDEKALLLERWKADAIR